MKFLVTDFEAMIITLAKKNFLLVSETFVNNLNMLEKY